MHAGSTFTSTCQHLAYHARAQPEAVAIVREDGTVDTYARLLRLVAQHVLALEALGVERGALVGLAFADRHLHLLLVLACQALDAISVSFSDAELHAAGRLVRSCRLILCGDEALGVLPGRHWASPSWQREILRLAVTEREQAMLVRQRDPSQVIRLIKTSGTTGESKVMALTAAIQQGRIAQQALRPRSVQGQQVVHQSIYPLTMGGAVTKLLGTLHLGGRIVFSSLGTFLHDMRRHGSNHTALLVGDTETILQQARKARLRNPVFFISIVGAALPKPLHQALLTELASELDNSYSSNEAGRVALVDEEGIGTVLPEVAVRICDAAGQVLPEGEAGFIQVRSDCVVTGYLGDPAGTSAAFADGWFHTSDWGFLSGPGRLRVLGRADDMLNVGGRKIPAGRVEQEIGGVAGVTAAAVVLVGSPQGVGHMAAMIEVAKDADRDAVIAETGAILARYTTCRLALSERLPRTETGKIRKAEIEDWFRHDMGFSDA